MILKKVALPLAMDGKSYWEAMMLEIANDKFCSLRANFKQELFEQFQGNIRSAKQDDIYGASNIVLPCSSS
jgi:hypothetical protein